MANEGILLESGTNEVEILEFSLNGQNFGVNVLKIQAIEQHDPERVTHIQLSHPSIVGTLLFRETCITLVDLCLEMENDPPATDPVDEAIDAVIESQPEESAGTVDDDVKNLVLVMEFNDMKTAFLVDGVNRIHRVSWESINPLSAFLNTSDSKFTGSLKIEDREILIVDMEKIVTEILPSKGQEFAVSADESHPNFAARPTKKIFLAEDSALIREKVTKELANGNYTNVKTFANGKECYDEMAKIVAQASAEGVPVTDYVDTLISDIEMPAMDGLALCKSIKDNPATRDVPVIMFSSLINEQIARKCEDVKANSYITKPQFAELVVLLDKYTMETAGAPA